MKQKSKRAQQWQENENKAKAMVSKFIAALKKVDCYSQWSALLAEGMMNEITSQKESPDAIQDTIEYTFGCRVFKSDSIATDIKIDEFLNDLKENPYQLNPIA